MFRQCIIFCVSFYSLHNFLMQLLNIICEIVRSVIWSPRWKKCPNSQIHDWSLSCLATGTSLQSAGIKLSATFNNNSVISWGSVLLMVETEKTTDLPRVTDKRYHIMFYRIHLVMNAARTHSISSAMHCLFVLSRLNCPFFWLPLSNFVVVVVVW
jgi:hypothetical protein